MFRHTRPFLMNLALLLLSGLVGVGLSEGALRALLRSARGYYALMPGTKWVFDVPPGLLPGVAGPVRYPVNRYGIRERLFGPNAAEYRILAVGGGRDITRLRRTRAQVGHPIDSLLPL